MGGAGIAEAIMMGVQIAIQDLGAMQTAKRNESIYKAEAKNVDSQKAIVASQYRSKAARLAGAASTAAASGGVNISGSTAQSISQSLTQLGIDQSYEQYNLDVEKAHYLDEANYQKTLKNQALFSLIFGIPTAMNNSTDFASKYWGKNSGGSATGFTPSIGSSSSGKQSGYMGTLPNL